jgi:hemoglobin
MRMRSLATMLTILLAGATLAVGCGGGGGGKQPETMAKAADQPLYDRLGGKDAITAVVAEFVGNVGADNRINAQFANSDLPAFKAKLVDQICAATGGPCTYTGKNMKDAHVGMKITAADFDALVEDLVKALDKLQVPAKEKAELLDALGPMKGDIVTVP